MTSKQVMLIAAMGLLGGCNWLEKPVTLASPYQERRIFAVAPLINESGSLQADGFKLADHLARQLENATNVDVLPVNRTIAAMQDRGWRYIASPDQAQQLILALGADALLVGTITAYDPYDPPKLGVALELYFNPRAEQRRQTLDLRNLSKSARGDEVLQGSPLRADRPAAVVSAFFDAADPGVREALHRYAGKRGVDMDRQGLDGLNPFDTEAEKHASTLYRISMDLYSQFVSYELSWRLLRAESVRLMPAELAQVDP